MSEISYKKHLIVFSVVLGVLALTIFVDSPGYTQLLPDHLGFQMYYIFWMSAIAGIIGSIFIGYILGPIFLIVHKYTLGIRMKYGIQDRPEPFKVKIGFKAIWPTLMAINFALMFSQFEWVQNIILSPTYVVEVSDKLKIPLVTLVTILPLMFGISMGLFSPIWFLLDGGIVFTNKEKVNGIRDPIEVRSVGGWYNYILKGYAGISIVFIYAKFTIDTLAVVDINPGIFLIPLLPFLLIVMAVPAFVILDITAKHRKRYMQKIAKKIGITEPLTNPLEIGNKESPMR
jgi:hypothetical protein